MTSPPVAAGAELAAGLAAVLAAAGVEAAAAGVLLAAVLAEADVGVVAAGVDFVELQPAASARPATARAAKTLFRAGTMILQFV